VTCTTNVSVDDLFGFLFVVVVEIFDSLLTIFVHFFYFFSIIFIITDEPKFWYFEIIIIMHKCIMTGAMVVVGNGTPMQPLVAMFLQLMFLLVVLKMAPYNDDLDDWSSFVCSLALTLTTLGGFLLMIPRQLTGDPVISVELLTTLLMAINGLCFAYEMLVIGYVAYQDRVTAALLKKTQKKLNHNSNSRPTKVLPMTNGDNADLRSWDGEASTSDVGKKKALVETK